MSKISVNNAWFYSFHGCLHEESVIGGEYIVSAVVETDTSLADQNDLLESTVDYVAIYNVLKKEMDTPSKLLEVVLERIIKELKKLTIILILLMLASKNFLLLLVEMLILLN